MNNNNKESSGWGGWVTYQLPISSSLGLDQLLKINVIRVHFISCPNIYQIYCPPQLNFNRSSKLYEYKNWVMVRLGKIRKLYGEKILHQNQLNIHKTILFFLFTGLATFNHWPISLTCAKNMNNLNICLPLCICAQTTAPHLCRRPCCQPVASIPETFKCQLEPIACKKDNKTIIKCKTIHTNWCTQVVLLPVTT